MRHYDVEHTDGGASGDGCKFATQPQLVLCDLATDWRLEPDWIGNWRYGQTTAVVDWRCSVLAGGDYRVGAGMRIGEF